MLSKQDKDESKYQGVPKRSNLYARVAKHAPRVINRLLELLESTNESVALGASRILMDKILPDVKPVVTQEGLSEPLNIIITEDKSMLGVNDET